MSELIQLTILLVVCTAVTCQSPAAVISEICQSESELFIDCPRLNDHQKSRLGQLLNSSSSGIKDMGAFPATSDIMGLYLHDNNIETIEPGAFDRLTSLSHLDVSHNDLTDIGFLSGGQQLLSLTFLDLSHNQIGLIDAASISRLHKLKTLKMNNNPIRALDDDTAVAISKLSNLAELNLAETQMKSLPDGLFSSGKLRFLDLHGNQLTDVPTAFQNAFTLIKLNLNANAIRTLHAASFIGLSGLLELKISMLDQLEQIEGNTFTPLRKLKKLDCSANPQLRSIHPNAFNNVTNLKEFEFSSNGVGSIPPYLLPWNTLDYYNIEKNLNICTTLNVTICQSSKIVWELIDGALIVNCVEADEANAYSPQTGCSGQYYSTTPSGQDVSLDVKQDEEEEEEDYWPSTSEASQPESTTSSTEEGGNKCVDGCEPAATKGSSPPTLKADVYLLYLFVQLVLVSSLK